MEGESFHMASKPSLAPTFLLSMPQMLDPNFSRTVVLLCRHSSDEGAFGLVVNRPLVTSGRVVINLDPPAEIDRELQLWIGGPVEPERSWILVSDDPDDTGSDRPRMQITDDLYISTDPDLLRRLVEPSPPAECPLDRRVLGLGAWSTGGRARGVVVVDERHRPRANLQYAAGKNVGNRDPQARRRPGDLADVARSPLMKRALLGVGMLMAGLVMIRAQEKPTPDAQTLQKMAARFAPTDVTADLSKFSASDRRVLAKLIEAAKVTDGLFLRQAWAGNAAMLVDLARDTSSEGHARLHYFLINKGPWSRLDHNQPFVPGAPPKPAGANYYPDGASGPRSKNGYSRFLRPTANGQAASFR